MNTEVKSMPSDKVKILISYDVREFYEVEVDREQLEDNNFSLNFTRDEVTYNLLKKEFVEYTDSMEVAPVSQKLFNQWRDEWEGE